MNHFSFLSLKLTGYTQTYIIHGQICTSLLLFAVLCLGTQALGLCCCVEVTKLIEVQALQVGNDAGKSMCLYF